ncbi:MAG: spoIIAA [Acidimicrobiales bacterium]|nr:spoIIAA [Acidimicrobiales bacterium]
MSDHTVPRLKIEVEADRPHVVFRLVGEVDMETSVMLARVVSEAIDTGAPKILLDCEGLTYLDSTGIGVLVQAWNQMKDRATMPVVVSNLQPAIRRVLDVCGVSELVVE